MGQVRWTDDLPPVDWGGPGDKKREGIKHLTMPKVGLGVVQRADLSIFRITKIEIPGADPSLGEASFEYTLTPSMEPLEVQADPIVVSLEILLDEYRPIGDMILFRTTKVG